MTALHALSSGTFAWVPQELSTQVRSLRVPWQVVALLHAGADAKVPGQSVAVAQQVPLVQQKPLLQRPL
ncbi:MAG: hypothetical protein IPG81_17850 [Sandaracinaceae bacterium]|nr:hypothetical protein [Sandaracinaceae bacterium]